MEVPFGFVVSYDRGLKGICSGFLSFVPQEGGEGWYVWMIRTVLEHFEGLGNPDDPSPIFKSPEPLVGENDSLEKDVSVLIIGAGQSGLSLAGRLGALGISYLLLEKESDVGCAWTGRYDAVRQHTIREMNNLPFDRTWKPTDPELLPASIVAEGHKNYVEKYRINIWLGIDVQSCDQLKDGVGWRVEVLKEGKKYLVKARHLVLCLGFGISIPYVPKIEGIESFEGTVLDIGQFQNSAKWKGKRGVVVGSGTAGHDGELSILWSSNSEFHLFESFSSSDICEPIPSRELATTFAIELRLFHFSRTFLSRI